jgi:5,10-methylenetetrahydromethanopterin reductase
MDFGIAIASNVDGWKTVKRAEQLGFTHAWFYDSQLLAPDVFVSIALAAANTTKIKLGTGVLVPTNRIAPVTANGFASLNKLAPGRIIFGVGTGFTARNTMGLAPMQLSDFREHLRVALALLKGETVEWNCEGAPHKIRFLNPDFGLINTADKIALHISAFAPKARKLTAEIADGWITFLLDERRALFEAETMAATCREAGRGADSLYKTVFTLGCVLRDGERFDSPRAIAQAGPLATVFLHGLAESSLPFSLPPEVAPLAEAYRKQYQSYQPADAKYLHLHRLHLLAVRPDEAKFVTSDLLRLVTFTGTRASLRERADRLRDGGFNQLTIQLVPGYEDAIDDWARLFEMM